MDVTLKDIAKASGVSISTVSRVLNKDTSRKSSEKTCRKVVQAARELGYISEYQSKAQQMYVDSGPVCQSIGCILTSDRESIGSSFVPSLLRGVQSELMKVDGDLAYHFFVKDTKDPDFTRYFETSRLDCALLVGRTSIENINLLRERVPNLVHVGVDGIENCFDEVLADAHAGMMNAVRYLADLGHRRIGFLGPTSQKEPNLAECRYRGYLDAMSACEIEADLVHDTALSSAEGYVSMAEMMKGTKIPTAVICASDMVALGAMRALSDNDIAIPADISVIGFDNIELATYVKPALTTIAVPARELGRLAIKTIFDRLTSGRDYGMRLILPCTLIERESCEAIGSGKKA
jgi:Transcriptional regulators